MHAGFRPGFQACLLTFIKIVSNIIASRQYSMPYSKPWSSIGSTHFRVLCGTSKPFILGSSVVFFSCPYFRISQSSK